MGEIETTKIIRNKNSQGLPSIALTASVLKEYRQKAKAVDMNDFLTKPSSIEELKKVFNMDERRRVKLFLKAIFCSRGLVFV